MADSLLSYAIATGVFIGLAVILFTSRAKRAGKKQPLVGSSEGIKQSADEK